MDSVLINNSGLVLVTPFLPALFSELSLVKNEKFVDLASSCRAAFLLDCIAGNRGDDSEHSRILNKALCAIDAGEPLSDRIDASERERELVDEMLRALISHWSSLGNSSVEGLQSTFLTRPGQLRVIDGHWQLRVEARSFDVLLDKLPWSYQFIKLPWMTRAVQVDWS